MWVTLSSAPHSQVQPVELFCASLNLSPAVLCVRFDGFLKKGFLALQRATSTVKNKVMYI